MEVYETKNLITWKSATLKGLNDHIRICRIKYMFSGFGIDVRLFFSVFCPKTTRPPGPADEEMKNKKPSPT